MAESRQCGRDDAIERHDLYVEIDGERFYTCPVAAVDRNLANEAFDLMNHYAVGHLPYAGGIYDQPERLLQMIEIMAAARAEKQRGDGK